MKRLTAALLSVLLAAMLLCSCSGGGKIKSLPDLEGRKVGVLAGSPLLSGDDGMTVYEYGNIFSLAEALKSGAVMAAVTDEDTAFALRDMDSKFTVLAGNYSTVGYSMIAAAGSGELIGQINSALKQLSDSGRLSRIMSGSETERPAVPASGTIPVLKVAVCSAVSSLQTTDADGNPAGPETELLYAVADRLGIGLEITDYSDFSDMIYMVESGKVSLGIGSICRIDSDDSTLVYSDSYFISEQRAVVLK